MTNDFDYTQLSPAVAQLAQSAAGRIKQHAATAARAAHAIGQELADVKEKLEHGQFTAWLRAEFDWTPQTARRYMRIADKYSANDLDGADIGLRTLDLLARDSVDDETRSTALERAKNGGLTFTSAADLVAGISGGSASPQNNPSYTPPSQVIIFDDDDLDDYDDDPDDYETYESALPIGRMTLTRTTERTTETAEIELAEAVQQPLPAHVMKIVYLDPVMVYHQPDRIESALQQLHELYYLVTGRHYNPKRGE